MYDNMELRRLVEKIDYIQSQTTEILVNSAEMRVEQSHLKESVTELKHDVKEIKDIQGNHNSKIDEFGKDISQIKSSLEKNNSNTFTLTAREFAMNHPILAIIIVLMVINIILMSVGVPIIDVVAIYGLIK